MTALAQEQIASAWNGIPTTYWPSPDKPWRITWGFGAFEDFASEAQAEERRTELLSSLSNGWQDSVGAVSNVHDRTREILAKAAV